MSTLLSRRALLRAVAAGAGGVALLPLMSSLTRADPTKSPRFLFIVEGNCYEPITVLDPLTKAAINAKAVSPIDGQRWWYSLYNHQTPIVVSGTQFSNTIALGSIASLGLATRTAVLFGLSSRVTGGGHTALHGVLSSTRSVGGVPAGKTIDAYMAGLPQVRLSTPYDAVRVGMVADAGTTRLSYSTCAFDKGKAAPAIVDPVAAYNSLFGLVGTAAEQQAFAQRKTLLDFAHQDVKNALDAFSGSSIERAKLETYLASLEDLGVRQQRLTTMAPQLSAVKPNSPSADPRYKTDCVYRFGSQIALAVAALKGQLTNVAVVTSGTGDDFSSLTYPSEPQSNYRTRIRHDLHHSSNTDPGALQTIHDITQQQFAIVAAAAADLANTPDLAGGSMLDTTVIVFIADNGEQHHSTASEFPVVLIGGQALGLKTGGRTIVYPGVDSGGTNHRQVSNLWNTLGHLAGDALDTFGGEGPTRIASGPLMELS